MEIRKSRPNEDPLQKGYGNVRMNYSYKGLPEKMINNEQRPDEVDNDERT